MKPARIVYLLLLLLSAACTVFLICGVQKWTRDMNAVHEDMVQTEKNAASFPLRLANLEDSLGSKEHSWNELRDSLGEAENEYERNLQNRHPIAYKKEKAWAWIDHNHTFFHSLGASSVIVLYNGEQVLSRNAAGSTQYRYFLETPGTYELYARGVNGETEHLSYVID